jgi:hypothetical protein
LFTLDLNPLEYLFAPIHINSELHQISDKVEKQIIESIAQSTNLACGITGSRSLPG